MCCARRAGHWSYECHDTKRVQYTFPDTMAGVQTTDITLSVLDDVPPPLEASTPVKASAEQHDSGAWGTEK